MAKSLYSTIQYKKDRYSYAFSDWLYDFLNSPMNFKSQLMKAAEILQSHSYSYCRLSWSLKTTKHFLKLPDVTHSWPWRIGRQNATTGILTTLVYIWRTRVEGNCFAWWLACSVTLLSALRGFPERVSAVGVLLSVQAVCETKQLQSDRTMNCGPHFWLIPVEIPHAILLFLSFITSQT